MDNKQQAGRIMRLISCIPLFVRRMFFRLLFFLLYLVSTSRRLITLQNVRGAFPEKSINEIKKIAKCSYRNLAITAAEFFDIPFLNEAKLRQRVRLEGGVHYEEAKRRGKGIIALGSHFGNWELQAPSGAFFLQKLGIVYRRLDNELLEAMTVLARTAHGSWLIPKGNAGQAIREYLLDSKFVGILADQNMDVTRGVFVDFFGKPACTAVAIAALAMQTGAAVMPVFMVRQKDGKYHLLLKPLVPVDDTGNYKQDLLTNTQRFTKAVEAVIREYPEQWFWMHQRWKTKRCQIHDEVAER